MQRQRNYHCFFGAGAGGSSRPLEVPAALRAASGGGRWELACKMAGTWQVVGVGDGGRTEDGGPGGGGQRSCARTSLEGTLPLCLRRDALEGCWPKLLMSQPVRPRRRGRKEIVDDLEQHA